MNPSKAAIKAKGLYNKFYWSIVEVPPEENKGNAKRCAVIHCDEMILFAKFHLGLDDYTVKFYEDVKKEIQSL